MIRKKIIYIFEIKKDLFQNTKNVTNIADICFSPKCKIRTMSFFFQAKKKKFEQCLTSKKLISENQTEGRTCED